MVSDCVRSQKPFVIEYPESDATRSMNEVLKNIFGLTGENYKYGKKSENSLLSFFKKLVETFEV